MFNAFLQSERLAVKFLSSDPDVRLCLITSHRFSLGKIVKLSAASTGYFSFFSFQIRCIIVKHKSIVVCIHSCLL